jgi:hypothetical protein
LALLQLGANADEVDISATVARMELAVEKFMVAVVL